jgi:predicted ArsR family transcriptional regulator
MKRVPGVTTTREQIISLLRGHPLTVGEIANDLKLSHNAVRTQLTAIERDGLVQRAGVRRSGRRRPAFVYVLTQVGERTFAKRYEVLLSGVLTVLAEAVGAAEQERILRQVGARLAAHQEWTKEEQPLYEKVIAAAQILEGLGGLVRVEQHPGGYVLRGAACPFIALVTAHPQICKLGESLVHTVVGVPVTEACHRRDVPLCVFEILPPSMEESLATGS